MKVMFLVEDVGTGGVLRQVSLLADGLTRKGHEIFVVGVAERDLDWPCVWNSPVPIALLYRDKASRAIARAGRFIEAVPALRKKLDQEKIDVLYAFQGDVAKLVSWLATRGSSVRMIWGTRGSDSRLRRRQGGWKRLLIGKSAAALSGLVPLQITNFAAGGARRRPLRPGHTRHRVIPNGFDTDTFAPDPAARARVRSEWNLRAEPLIGIASRLAPSKGHRVFLHGAVSLLRRRPDARFIVIGGGPERDKLEALSRELGLTDRIIWAGVRRDMSAVYNGLDILCLPSLGGEGCPNVVGEAMACGVPCVVTDVGDSANLVGDYGPVVPPGDAEALARAVASMMEKLTTVDRGRIRERIVKEFSVEAMVDRTEQALRDAAGVSGRH